MGIKNALQRVLFPELSFHGINFPSAHEARWLTDQARYSPDLGYLEQFEFQLLFAPADFRLGYIRHGLIENGVPLCGAYTQLTYEYWMQEVGLPDGSTERIDIPMRKDGPRVLRYAPPPLKIKGEIHAIRPGQFLGLDTFKRNTEQFRRQRVNVLVPYRVKSDLPLDNDGMPYALPSALAHKNYQFESPERVYVIRAWMYVGMPDYWNNLLDAGFRGFKSVNRHTSRRGWLKEYYDFPKHPLEK